MTPLFRQEKSTGVWWRDHSLSLVVGALLLAQTGFLIWSGQQEWSSMNRDSGSFWMWWAHEYVMSAVADTYGVLLIVVLSKWFVERGSAESKQPEEIENG